MVGVPFKVHHTLVQFYDTSFEISIIEVAIAWAGVAMLSFIWFLVDCDGWSSLGTVMMTCFASYNSPSIPVPQEAELTGVEAPTCNGVRLKILGEQVTNTADVDTLPAGWSKETLTMHGHPTIRFRWMAMPRTGRKFQGLDSGAVHESEADGTDGDPLFTFSCDVPGGVVECGVAGLIAAVNLAAR